MTKGQLKKKIDNCLLSSIINLVKDPTLGNTLKDQLQGIIFLHIANDYWDNCNDSDEL